MEELYLILKNFTFMKIIKYEYIKQKLDLDEKLLIPFQEYLINVCNPIEILNETENSGKLKLIVKVERELKALLKCPSQEISLKKKMNLENNDLMQLLDKKEVQNIMNMESYKQIYEMNPLFHIFHHFKEKIINNKKNNYFFNTVNNLIYSNSKKLINKLINLSKMEEEYLVMDMDKNFYKQHNIEKNGSYDNIKELLTSTEQLADKIIDLHKNGKIDYSYLNYYLINTLFDIFDYDNNETNESIKEYMCDSNIGFKNNHITKLKNMIDEDLKDVICFNLNINECIRFIQKDKIDVNKFTKEYEKVKDKIDKDITRTLIDKVKKKNIKDLEIDNDYIKNARLIYERTNKINFKKKISLLKKKRKNTDLPICNLEIVNTSRNEVAFYPTNKNRIEEMLFNIKLKLNNIEDRLNLIEYKKKTNLDQTLSDRLLQEKSISLNSPIKVDISSVNSSFVNLQTVRSNSFGSLDLEKKKEHNVFEINQSGKDLNKSQVINDNDKLDSNKKDLPVQDELCEVNNQEIKKISEEEMNIINTDVKKLINFTEDKELEKIEFCDKFELDETLQNNINKIDLDENFIKDQLRERYSKSSHLYIKNAKERLLKYDKKLDEKFITIICGNNKKMIDEDIVIFVSKRKFIQNNNQNYKGYYYKEKIDSDNLFVTVWIKKFSEELFVNKLVDIKSISSLYENVISKEHIYDKEWNFKIGSIWKNMYNSIYFQLKDDNLAFAYDIICDYEDTIIIKGSTYNNLLNMNYNSNGVQQISIQIRDKIGIKYINRMELEGINSIYYANNFDNSFHHKLSIKEYKWGKNFHNKFKYVNYHNTTIKREISIMDIKRLKRTITICNKYIINKIKFLNLFDHTIEELSVNDELRDLFKKNNKRYSHIYRNIEGIKFTVLIKTINDHMFSYLCTKTNTQSKFDRNLDEIIQIRKYKFDMELINKIQDQYYDKIRNSCLKLFKKLNKSNEFKLKWQIVAKGKGSFLKNYRRSNKKNILIPNKELICDIIEFNLLMLENVKKTQLGFKIRKICMLYLIYLIIWKDLIINITNKEILIMKNKSFNVYTSLNQDEINYLEDNQKKIKFFKHTIIYVMETKIVKDTGFDFHANIPKISYRNKYGEKYNSNYFNNKIIMNKIKICKDAWIYRRNLIRRGLEDLDDRIFCHIFDNYYLNIPEILKEEKNFWNRKNLEIWYIIFNCQRINLKWYTFQKNKNNWKKEFDSIKEKIILETKNFKEFKSLYDEMNPNIARLSERFREQELIDQLLSEDLDNKKNPAKNVEEINNNNNSNYEDNSLRKEEHMEIIDTSSKNLKKLEAQEEISYYDDECNITIDEQKEDQWKQNIKEIYKNDILYELYDQSQEELIETIVQLFEISNIKDFKYDLETNLYNEGDINFIENNNKINIWALRIVIARAFQIYMDKIIDCDSIIQVAFRIQSVLKKYIK